MSSCQFYLATADLICWFYLAWNVSSTSVSSNHHKAFVVKEVLQSVYGVKKTPRNSSLFEKLWNLGLKIIFEDFLNLYHMLHHMYV